MNTTHTYSRKTRVEEKRNIRKALLFGFLTICAVILFVLFGFGLLARFAVFLGEIKRGSQPIESNDSTPPIPPRFEPIPKATNKSSFDITGSTEPGASVKLTFNGREYDILANNDGEFRYVSTLKDGENSFAAYSYDNAGNKSPETNTQTITYDNTAPTLEVTKPKDGESFYGSRGRQLIIEATTEPNMQASVNARHVVVEANGNFTFLTTLSEGENKILIKAQDEAGNATEKELTVTYAP